MSTSTDVKVIVEKPRLPMLWIDTCVASDMVEFLQFESGNSSYEKERAKALDSALAKVVAEGKLLCPTGDQEEEFRFADFNPDFPSAIAEKYARLSLGIRMRHRTVVEWLQVVHAMSAYVSRSSTVFIPIHTFYRSDPVEQLRTAKAMGLSTGMPSFFNSPHDRAQYLISKENTFREVTTLKQASPRTYEEHVKEEELGLLDAFEVTIDQFSKRPPQNSREGNQLRAWEPYLRMWSVLGGKPPGVAGLKDFFASEHIRALPMTSVRSRLWADLLTGKKKIQPSDSMDVDMLAAAIPASHFIFTDRAMTARVRRVRLEQRWGTKVFSLANADEFLKELAKL